MLPPKRKAVFLDRDGTIIRHVEYLTRQTEVKLLPRAGEAIARLNSLGYMVFIVTNQSVVARGLISPTEVEAINDLVVNRLNKKGAKIHGVYYCPHHPEMHPDVPEHAKQYRLVCNCRKPAPGMLLQAIKEFNIERDKSFMIGDSLTDIAAGKRAKVKTIRVKTGPADQRLDAQYGHITPDFEVAHITDAVKIISKA